MLSEESYNDYSKAVQSLIQNLSDGQTKLEDLLKQQTTSVNQHATSEAHITRQHVTAEVMKTEENRAKLAEFQSLFNSLRYPRMNERRNQIRPSHEKTFAWAYSGMTAHDTRSFSSSQDSTWTDEDDDLSRSEGSTSHGGESEREYSDRDESNRNGTEDVKVSRLLAHPFKDWLRDPAARLYWVSGKPGSGKSTFMKFLFTDERTKKELNVSQSDRDVRILSHFFWIGGQDLQRNTRGMKLSLLDQLLEDTSTDPTLPTRLFSEFDFLKRKHHHTDWSDEELEDVLVAACELSSSDLCVFLDGLDEITIEDRRGPATIITLIQRLCSLDGVKICASSRPEKDLERFLVQFPHLRMQDLSHFDIRRYAEDRLNSFDPVAPDVTRHDMENLLDIICRHAAGVFLWVALALKSLETGIIDWNTADELAKRLELLPTELDALYTDMWERANGDQNKRLYAEQAAVFLMHALNVHEARALYIPHYVKRGPLDDTTPSHISVYLCVSEPELMNKILETFSPLVELEYERLLARTRQSIETRTAGLLQIDQNSDVGFVHRSAVDFLKETEKGKMICAHPDPSITSRVILARHYGAGLVKKIDQCGRHDRSDDSAIWNEISFPRFASTLAYCYEEDLLDSGTVLSLLDSRSKNFALVEGQSEDPIISYRGSQLPVDLPGCYLCCSLGPPLFSNTLTKLRDAERRLGTTISSTYASYLLQVACQAARYEISHIHAVERISFENIEYIIKACFKGSSGQTISGHRDFNRAWVFRYLDLGRSFIDLKGKKGFMSKWSHFTLNTPVQHLVQSSLFTGTAIAKCHWPLLEGLGLEASYQDTSIVLCRVELESGSQDWRTVDLLNPLAWRNTVLESVVIHGDYMLEYGGDYTFPSAGALFVLQVDIRFHLPLLITQSKHNQGEFRAIQSSLTRLLKKWPPHDRCCTKVLAISQPEFVRCQSPKPNDEQVFNIDWWAPRTGEDSEKLSRAFQPDGNWKPLTSDSQNKSWNKSWSVPEFSNFSESEFERLKSSCKIISDTELNEQLCDLGLAIRSEDAAWTPPRPFPDWVYKTQQETTGE